MSARPKRSQWRLPGRDNGPIPAGLKVRDKGSLPNGYLALSALVFFLSFNPVRRSPRLPLDRAGISWPFRPTHNGDLAYYFAFPKLTETWGLSCSRNRHSSSLAFEIPIQWGNCPNGQKQSNDLSLFLSAVTFERATALP